MLLMTTDNEGDTTSVMLNNSIICAFASNKCKHVHVFSMIINELHIEELTIANFQGKLNKGGGASFKLNQVFRSLSLWSFI